jgi:hypothetical protein
MDADDADLTNGKRADFVTVSKGVCSEPPIDVLFLLTARRSQLL